jgi:hypothetical protein
LAIDTELAKLVLSFGLPQRLKLQGFMRNVLLLIGVVLRSRIIPRKKWEAIPVIWKVIRLAWCPRREPR